MLYPNIYTQPVNTTQNIYPQTINTNQNYNIKSSPVIPPRNASIKNSQGLNKPQSVNTNYSNFNQP